MISYYEFGSLFRCGATNFHRKAAPANLSARFLIYHPRILITILQLVKKLYPQTEPLERRSSWNFIPVKLLTSLAMATRPSNTKKRSD